MSLYVLTASAAEIQGTANVQLLKAISINEETALDFGPIENKNGVCSMNSAGELSGSDGQTCSGTRTPALFTINGENGYTVNLAAKPSSIDGITFAPLIDGSTSLTINEGSISVNIIGSLLLSGATTGNKNIPFIFTANYQ